MTVVEFEDKRLNLTADGIFYTVQGEGRFVGVPSVFVRLSGCNLRCEWHDGGGRFTKCDTPYSSFEPEKNLKSIRDIVAKVLSYSKAKHVVVTGGEPMLQTNVTLLIDELSKRGKFVTVETNGTIYRPSKAAFFSISPKLATSCPGSSPNFEAHHAKRFNIQALAEMMRHQHQFKFVVNSKHDILEIEGLIQLLAAKVGGFDCENVYLMPQGITPQQFDAKLPWIVEEAKAHRWNVTDRLHVRIWGARRGV